jgi:hypothetical protein
VEVKEVGSEKVKKEKREKTIYRIPKPIETHEYISGKFFKI